ncbi:TPA: hypothetical protein QCX24_003026 [Bacillus toyonensis]|uniref:hypothetical protein n=1 Tax=Bacillus cereus group TaxID=86661 RepID=UPI000BFC7FDB|nr:MULTISPECIES: hypothetical protein [Bacillus cereus group]PHA81592.1 hypothetical protein COE74_27870 [Bacillus toyonensis]QWI06077.1 hypothetical protein EXW54_15820 [Bacillus toyonensis]QWI46909.1 hypothetical protein EXW55_28990 [Bacillus mycoides]HDR7383805.1 hypothetical protein [Bacillus toyonensis]
MIDYQSHLAALNVTLNNLENLTSSGNSKPELEELQKVIKDNYSYALLGSIIDHILEHDKISEIELDRLTKASELWGMFRNFILEVESIRETLESLVLDPNQSELLEKANNLGLKFKDLKPQFDILVAKLQAFYDEIKDLKHVVQHGQARDTPVINWNWRDIILSRRTGAFMSNLLSIAQNDGSPKVLSFALGALSSYSSNVTGSSYINMTVGGPRRSHPHRDRLASYTIGSWFKLNRPDLTTSFTNLTSKVSFGAPNAPALPKKINKLLTNALKETYGQFNLTEYPDLNNAYQKLVQHLNLLSSFKPLPLPKPIDDTLWGNTLKSNMGPGPYPGPYINQFPQKNPTPTPDDSSKEDHEWWEWVLFGICIAASALAGLFASDGQNDPYRSPFQNTGEVQQYLSSNDALGKVNLMFDLHCQLYEIANNGLMVLKLIGMIYPDAIDLDEKQFSQFTSIPRNEIEGLKRQISDLNKFLEFPYSPVEDPKGTVSPYPANSTPNVFLEGSSDSAGEYGLSLWIQAASGIVPELQKINYNLDADRGYKHECWEVNKGSILDNPVSVKVLGYKSL